MYRKLDLKLYDQTHVVIAQKDLGDYMEHAVQLTQSSSMDMTVYSPARTKNAKKLISAH